MTEVKKKKKKKKKKRLMHENKQQQLVKNLPYCAMAATEMQKKELSMSRNC